MNWKFDDNLEPYNYRLGGTPLDHTLVAMRKFLPEFNKKYNIEKSILTVITDFSHSSDISDKMMQKEKMSKQLSESEI